MRTTNSKSKQIFSPSQNLFFIWWMGSVLSTRKELATSHLSLHIPYEGPKKKQVCLKAVSTWMWKRQKPLRIRDRNIPFKLQKTQTFESGRKYKKKKKACKLP